MMSPPVLNVVPPLGGTFPADASYWQAIAERGHAVGRVLADAGVINGLGFGADETGVVFHLLGCLSELGKLGCVAIAPTVHEARQRFDQAVAMLDDLATG